MVIIFAIIFKVIISKSSRSTVAIQLETSHSRFRQCITNNVDTSHVAFHSKCQFI